MLHDRTLHRIARKLRSGPVPPPTEPAELPDLLARLHAKLAERRRR